MNDTFRPADSTVDPSGRSLDQAIDRAVREIINVDGPPDLRARVLSRLEPSSSRVFTWPRLVAAAAVIALLASIPFMRAPRPAEPPTVAGPAHPTPPAARVQVDAGASAQAITPVRPPARHSTRRARTVEATVAAEMPETIPPLEEINPIVVMAPLTRDIEPAEIDIAPLRPIPDLSVEAIAFPPGERN
jgi:hypothetical protein